MKIKNSEEKKEINEKLKQLYDVLHKKEAECEKEILRLGELVAQQNMFLENIDVLNKSIKTKDRILGQIELEIVIKNTEYLKIKELSQKNDNDLINSRVELEKIKKDIENTKKTLQLLNNEDTIKRDSYNKLCSSFTAIETEITQKNVLKNKLDNDILYLDGEKTKKRNDLVFLDDEILQKTKIKTELDLNNKKLGDEVVGLENKFLSEKKEINANSLILENIKKEVQKGIEKIKKDQIEFEKWVEEKTRNLEKREGEISQKTQWYEQKRELLIEAKSSLESFYNQKIDNIII